MSRLRMTFSRLLALGGFTALPATFAYCRYNLLGDSSATTDCKPAQFYGGGSEPSLSPEERKRWDDNWDLRKPENCPHNAGISEKPEVPIVDVTSETVSSCPSAPLGVEPSSATRHVLLIRHGQYVHNDDDCFRILTDLGRKQATLTGERLKSLGIKFNNMVVSTMTRAQETARLIGEFLPPDIEKNSCSLLREGAPYPLEPKSSVWNPLDRTFLKDNPRIEGAFRKYIHRADPKQKEDSYDLLVCHANVIRYLVCRSLQFPSEGWGRMSIAHCGLTWLSIRPNGRVSLRGLGDIGHLPPDLITYH